MSIQGPEPTGRFEETYRSVYPESPKARQIPSQGGILHAIGKLFGAAWRIISFADRREKTALFKELSGQLRTIASGTILKTFSLSELRELKTNLEDESGKDFFTRIHSRSINDFHKANKVLTATKMAQKALFGRISESVMLTMRKAMQEHLDIPTIEMFADLCNAKTIETFSPLSSAFQGHIATNINNTQLQHLFNNLVNEIMFFATMLNTQEIHTVLPRHRENRILPYLHTKYDRGENSFALLFEPRPGELLITDPHTKETRAFTIDPTKKEATQEDEQAYEQTIRALNARAVPNIEGKRVEEVMQMRNIYQVTVDDETFLSLLPQDFDNTRAKEERITQNMIEQMNYWLSYGTPDENSFALGETNVRVITDRTDGELAATFRAADGREYITHYHIPQDADFGTLIQTLNDDGTLERDLLLAKAFFMRPLEIPSHVDIARKAIAGEVYSEEVLWKSFIYEEPGGVLPDGRVDPRFSPDKSYHIEIATQENDGVLAVTFTVDDTRRFTIDYPMREGESKAELAQRIASNQTLEIDIVRAVEEARDIPEIES